MFNELLWGQRVVLCFYNKTSGKDPAWWRLNLYVRHSVASHLLSLNERPAYNSNSHKPTRMTSSASLQLSRRQTQSGLYMLVIISFSSSAASNFSHFLYLHILFSGNLTNSYRKWIINALRLSFLSSQMVWPTDSWSFNPIRQLI